MVLYVTPLSIDAKNVPVASSSFNVSMTFIWRQSEKHLHLTDFLWNIKVSFLFLFFFSSNFANYEKEMAIIYIIHRSFKYIFQCFWMRNKNNYDKVATTSFP